MKKLAIITSLILLTGCAAQMAELENVGKEPALEQVLLPMEKDTYEPLEWIEEYEHPEKKYVNSLWQPGSREFFKNIKARRVGDILKIAIKIQDKAELDNATSRTRDNEEDSSAPSIYGLQDKLLDLIPGVAANPAKLLDLTASGKASGTGTVAREETIETEVAAMVTQILPNGNLVIHGDQEVRVNFEIRKITVDGIVRQEDISADNSIDSNQIAEARISYGGRGQLTNVQQPRLGNQIIDILSPF